MEKAPKPALIVMAKWPAPGEVKTRLVPPLTAEEAASLYRAMLLDVVEAALVLDGPAVLVGFHPPDKERSFAALLPPGLALIAQRGEHLAARMEGCLAKAFGQGYGPVLMRNSDAPTLPERIIADALEALAGGADAAFSPDASGGYGLVALSGPAPGLFGEPLESENSYAETLARCRAAGLEAAEVESWYDVDAPADLARLLEEWGEGRCPAHVEKFLRERGRGKEWEKRLLLGREQS